MRNLKAAIAALTVTMAVFVSGTTFSADVEDIIEARQSFMRVYAFNLGIVGAMAKGKTEYNQELASSAAQNLVALSKMENSAMWPEGSSKAAEGLSDKTDALEEMWTTWPEVKNRHEEAAKAIEAFAMLAAKDLESLRGGMKDLGAGCKGCHKDFRAKDED